MKKLFLLLLIALAFVSCQKEPSQTLSDVDNIAYKNNATDDKFANTTHPSYNGALNNTWFYNGYKRKKGKTGIIGKWVGEDSSLTETVVFNSDGTFSFVRESATSTLRKSGTFELYIDNDMYTLHIIYSDGLEFRVKYVVSDNCFCTEGYSTYSLI